MKVSFTAKEYARILELAYLGLRVASSGSDAPDVLPERYADAAQKLFALATPLGCADLVEEVAEGEFQPSEKLESEALLEKITRFEEDSFWRELVERLAGPVGPLHRRQGRPHARARGEARSGGRHSLWAPRRGCGDPRRPA
jgi:hypothetical protein